MRKYISFKATVVLFITCSVFISCSVLQVETKQQTVHHDPHFKPKQINKTSLIDMHLKPELESKEIVRVYSRSLTRTKYENKIGSSKEETVDFSVQSRVTKVDPKTQDRTVLVESLRKDGPTDLYDLGYPEVGEALEFVYTTKAQVRKAGHFPPNSLFFLSPISLPKKPVEVGDTWDYQAKWVSLRNGLPMQVDLVSIFKRMYSCGVNSECAEIEVSGEIQIPEGLTRDARLESVVTGRILFDLHTGAIVWSDIRNKEKLTSGEDVMEIISCTETIVEEPVSSRWPWRAQVGCDPLAPLPVNVPGV